MGFIKTKLFLAKNTSTCRFCCCSRSTQGSDDKGNKDWFQFLLSEKEDKLEQLEYAFWNGHPPTELWKQNDPEEFMKRYFVENPLAEEKGLKLPFVIRWLFSAVKSVGSFSLTIENVIAVLVLMVIMYFAAVLLLLLVQTLSRLIGTIAVSLLLSTLLVWLLSKSR